MAHLFVIAGHGHGDSGAVGNGFTEAERVRALASRIGELGGSNVTLGDMSRDYYADNGISKLNIPKDWAIIELHMDSGASSAKGGHVIICSGLNADAYDNALANFIGGILPGRSNKIVARNNLANPRRAKARGFNYRLLECGFISNANDVAIFNNRMDEIARGILAAFGIGASGKVNTPAPTPVPTPTPKPTNNTNAGGTQAMKNAQVHINNFCGAGLVADGIIGPKTRKGLIKALQVALNKDYNAKLVEDGIWGPKTKAALGNHCVGRGDTQYLVTFAKIGLTALSYFGNAVESPGKFGSDFEKSVYNFQVATGLTKDKIVGKNTINMILTKLGC